MPIVGLKVILVGLGMFILALAVGDAVAQCAPGLISRGNSCCKPADCKINQDYILCDQSDKNGEDKCEPCYTGTVNPKPFNTAVIPDKNFPKYCQKPECGDSVCPPEAEVANTMECLRTGKAVCQCSLSKDYCGSDPLRCRSSKEYDIPEGHQLMQNCSIKKCEEGYSRADNEYACEKNTNISTTTQPTTPFTSGASGTDVLNEVDTTNTTIPSINEDQGGGLDLKVVIIIALSSLASLAVIILGVWMGIKLCCRNKFGQVIQRLKNAVLNNGVNNQLNGIPEEQNVSDESTEATSMV